MVLTPELLAEVDSFDALAQLFYNHLGWREPIWEKFDGVVDLYGIPTAAGVKSIQAVQQLDDTQTWGIFLVDFGENEPRRSQLREILNRVSEKRSNLAERTWAHDNILFVCRSQETRWTLGHYRGDKPATAQLKTFGWSDSSDGRTACENLKKLVWDNQSYWSEAWNVEHLSDTFFSELYLRFQEIEQLWLSPFTSEDRRTATQLLINRLLFVCFLQKKEWLELGGSRSDYLFRLYESTDTTDPDAETFSRRLELLFFSGLSTPNATPGDRKALEKEIGRVPFLNGGLFDRSPTDYQRLPNRAYAKLLGSGGLLRSYNFTIEESTPLDVAVAIDPEMLGKVFEELVNKRHDTGSYYTPKAIVSFMCREAIKGYLGGYERLVDEHDAEGITVTQARELIKKLERVKFCDPACGSGAYLVGMLQEIFILQRLLDTASHTDRLDYHRRKVVIENCLYGVDLEQFAVTIAWLRLWLALVIDNPVNPLDDPDADVALPNLDLKLEAGDSVASGDPQLAVVQSAIGRYAQGGLDLFGVDAVVNQYIARRAEYQDSHGPRKRELRIEIDALKAEINQGVSTTSFSDRAFLWAIEYPEVFLSEDPEFVKGFDIVLANPPYVRQETIKETMGGDYKKKLVATYPNSGSGTADLFIYFYDRGLQLLKPGGMFVYISSNKWFRSDYGQKLRRHIDDSTTVLSITDFGDLPVFKSALAYAMIFVARKAETAERRGQAPFFTAVESLSHPYPNVKNVISMQGFILPDNAIQGGDWTLADRETLRKLSIMQSRGTPLGDYVSGQIYRGVLTGLNEAFFVDATTRQMLIEADRNSTEVIKPLAVGKDVRRWRINSRDQWLIVTRIGVDMNRYPAVMAHLSKYEKALRARQDQGNQWWELRACAYYDVFETSRIIYPVMVTEPRFALAEPGLFTNDKAFFLPSGDEFLLGVLNSSVSWLYLWSKCSTLQGNTIELRAQNLAKLPIPQASGEDKTRIANLVRSILAIKARDDQADVSSIESEIDSRVNFLFFDQRRDEPYDTWRARLAEEAETEVGAIRILSRRGEDETLEFKSSIIWNVRADRHDLVMRDEVLKEISAFLNANGGTIICGMDDSGAIVGLEKDLKHAGSKDKLGLVITNALGDLLKPHPVELVKMKFIDIDGETILRIDVQPDRKNRYESPSTKKEDAGKNILRTHVRVGASAKALDVGDAIAWWERRKAGGPQQ